MSTAKLAPNTDNLFLGKGALYFDRFDAGNVKTGELDLGNVTAFGLTKAATKKDHYTSREGIRKKDKSITVEEKWTGKFIAEEYSKENMILALGGDALEYAVQTAGAATADITAFRDRWIDVGYKSISAVVVTHGMTTFTVDVDYKVDSTIGRIMPLYTGAIYEGEPLHVAFSYASINQPIIKPSIREVKGFMRFVPHNDMDNGPNYMAEIWSALLTCDSEISFLTEDWGKLNFTADIDEDDEGGTHKTGNPYFKLTEIKASTIIS